MKTYSFTIIASGLDAAAPDFADRFYEAGCDDSTISIQRGLIVLEFDREARNFSHAVTSAMQDVESAGAKVERIEPDEFVSAADIAKRSSLGRAAISHYTTGLRGKEFPLPVARVTTDSPLWDWLEVAAWLFRRRRVPLTSVVQARIVKEINQALAGKGFERPSLLEQHLQRRRDAQHDRISA